MKRLLEHLLMEDATLVRVKSWRPCWVNGHIEWPCMLIDVGSGNRMTVWPVWDWVRVRSLFWTRKDDWVTLSVPLSAASPAQRDLNSTLN